MSARLHSYHHHTGIIPKTPTSGAMHTGSTTKPWAWCSSYPTRSGGPGWPASHMYHFLAWRSRQQEQMSSGPSCTWAPSALPKEHPGGRWIGGSLLVAPSPCSSHSTISMAIRSMCVLCFLNPWPFRGWVCKSMMELYLCIYHYSSQRGLWGEQWREGSSTALGVAVAGQEELLFSPTLEQMLTFLSTQTSLHLCWLHAQALS